jgi:predicted metal-dependent phosphoesterase TrpH
MKIDIHNHSYYSYDGFSSPERLVRAAKQKGIDGIALTDHESVEGWKEAREAAKKYGILFIPGEEVKTIKDGKIIGDIIGLFLKKEIKNREPKKVIKEIRDQGGLVIIPHPFHLLSPFKGENVNKKLSFRLFLPFTGSMTEFKRLIDAVEVLNSRIPTEAPDRKARAFAKQNRIAMVGASDAHYWKDIGDAYTLAEDAKNLKEFKEAILNKKTKAEGKKSPLRSIAALATPSLSKIKIDINNHRYKKKRPSSLARAKTRIKKYSRKRK